MWVIIVELNLRFSDKEMHIYKRLFGECSEKRWWGLGIMVGEGLKQFQVVQRGGQKGLRIQRGAYKVYPYFEQFWHQNPIFVRSSRAYQKKCNHF